MCRQITTDDYVGDDRRKYEEWHLDKNVPITIIGALVLYAGIAIWWGSKMETQIIQVQKEQEKKAIEEKERVYDRLLNDRVDNVKAMINPINQTLIRLDVKISNIVPDIQTTFREHETRVLKQIEKHDDKRHNNK